MDEGESVLPGRGETARGVTEEAGVGPCTRVLLPQLSGWGILFPTLGQQQCVSLSRSPCRLAGEIAGWVGVGTLLWKEIRASVRAGGAGWGWLTHILRSPGPADFGSPRPQDCAGIGPCAPKPYGWGLPDSGFFHGGRGWGGKRLCSPLGAAGPGKALEPPAGLSGPVGEVGRPGSRRHDHIPLHRLPPAGPGRGAWAGRKGLLREVNSSVSVCELPGWGSWTPRDTP